MKAKMILAILGQTKFGKSTLLALLSNIFLRLLRIFSKTNGRTKTLTEYWYDRNNEGDEIYVEDIDVRWEKCLGGIQNDVKAYNENLEKNTILIKVLRLSPLTDDANPRKYVEKQLKGFMNRPVSDDEIAQLLCTPGLDNFIRKVTLRVPANNILKVYMEEKNVDIIIRDTKGLLDVSMDEGLKKTNANLTEVGLDGIDGAILGCNDSYPNVIQELYEDILKNVFKSVPTFFVSRDKRMFNTFGKKDDFTKEEVETFINGIQNNENPDYEDADDEFFRETYKLFNSLGIMQKDLDGEYSFSEVYFGRNQTQFIMPSSKSLARFGTGDLTDEQLSSSTDLRFLQTVVSIIVLRMTDLIVSFRTSVTKLKSEEYACKFMLDAAQRVKGELMEDFAKYDNASRGYDSTIYCRPQLQSVSKDDIESTIDDASQDILGVYGGITTRNNGRLRYFATAVVAVSSRKWLDHIISAVEVKNDICDADGHPLFSGLSGNYAIQTRFVKSILRNCLYHDYTDNNAAIQSHLCVDRYKAVFGIEERRNAPTLQNAFEQTVEIIVNDFCRSLSTSEVGI